MRFEVTKRKFVLVRYGVCSFFLRGSCMKVNGHHAGMSSKYSVELVSNGAKEPLPGDAEPSHTMNCSL